MDEKGQSISMTKQVRWEQRALKMSEEKQGEQKQQKNSAETYGGKEQKELGGGKGIINGFIKPVHFM